MLRAVLAASLALAACGAQAQVNPFSIVGRAVSTAIDVRTKAEVKADTEIGAGASRRLLDDKRAEVVLMGVAGSGEEASLAVTKVRSIKGVKTVKSHLRVVKKKG